MLHYSVVSIQLTIDSEFLISEHGLEPRPDLDLPDPAWNGLQTPHNHTYKIQLESRLLTLNLGSERM